MAKLIDYLNSLDANVNTLTDFNNGMIGSVVDSFSINQEERIALLSGNTFRIAELVGISHENISSIQSTDTVF